MDTGGFKTRSATRTRGDRNLRRSVLIIYLAALLQGVVGIVFPASSAVLRERLLLGDTLYGAIFLPGFGIALATALLGPVLLRRWSLRSLFVFGLATQAVALAMIGLAGSIGRGLGLPVLIAAMALTGPGSGIMGIVLNTAAIEIFPRARSGALSALHGLLGSGAAAGPLMVAAFAQAGFWAAAPVSFAAGALILALLSTPRPLDGMSDVLEPAGAPQSVPARLRWRAVTPFLYGVSEATFTAWAVVFLVENRSLLLHEAAAALSAYWMAMTVGRIGCVFALRRISPLRLSLLLSVCMTVSFALLPGIDGAAGASLRFGFAGLSCSGLFPLLLGLASAEFPERTPRVSAVFSAAVLAGLAAGAFCVGPLRGWIGLERVYLFSGILPLVMAGILIALARPRRSELGRERGRTAGA